MSGFFLLNWARNSDPTEIERVLTLADSQLRRSQPAGAVLQAEMLAGSSYRCSALRNPDAASTPSFKRADGSWILACGWVSYGGRNVASGVLPELLEAMLRDPVSTCKHLDGAFALVAHDANHNRLLVVPSGFGQYAVYFRSLPDGSLAVSSSLFTLSGLAPVSFDQFTCQSLYRCGQRMPPHTIFHEIKSVNEGSFLELSGNRIVSRQYWTPVFENGTHRTVKDAAAAVGQHLSDYCAAGVGSAAPVVTDLTGGYDSRVTTACLLRRDIPFVANVAGPAHHPDVLLSSSICKSEQLPLQVVDPVEDPATLASDIENAFFLSETALDTFVFATTLRVKRTIFGTLAHHPVTTVSGALGECYRDFYWAQEFFGRGHRKPASLDRLIRYRIDCTPTPMGIFVHDWQHEWRSQLEAYLSSVIEPYAGERNTSQIDMVYLRKMTGMAGGFSSALSRMSVPLLPFSSARALDIALAVPTEWRNNSRLLREVAWWLHPRFASYTTLKGCPCAPMSLTNWHHFLPKYKLEVERVVRKISTVWFGHTLFPEFVETPPRVNPYSDFIGQETRNGGHFHFSSMRTASWYNPEKLNQILLESCTPSGYSNRKLLSWMYTCEAAARLADVRTTDNFGPADRE